jgi:aminoglycoside phosphotransferase (APT) family kinase protein
LIGALEARLLGREQLLAWAHGDFGYGNALVNPATGELTGVIDWDTAREDELAGVDLVNFLTQRHRMEHGVPLSGALEAVGDRVLRAEFEAVPPEAAREVLVVTFLRFFQRSARYPRVFAREHADLRRAAGWCERVLRAGEVPMTRIG